MVANRNIFPQLVHLRVNVNGRLDLIQMEVNPDGKLKYLRHRDDIQHSSAVANDF